MIDEEFYVDFFKMDDIFDVGLVEDKFSFYWVGFELFVVEEESFLMQMYLYFVCLDCNIISFMFSEQIIDLEIVIFFICEFNKCMKNFF